MWKNFSPKTPRENHLEYLCVNGKILLKLIQKTGCENNDLFYLIEDRETVSCGYSNQIGG
jgi:hypothetical protein